MARLVTLLCWLLLSPGGWAAEAAPGLLREEDVTVDYRNGTYFANLSLWVAASPARTLEVLTDFEHMADFIPNLQVSRVLARSGHVYRVYQRGKVEFGPFAFPFESERRIEWFPDGRLVTQALSGSSKYMRSELRYQADGGGTRIDYRIEAVPDRWLPSGMGVNLLRHELAEQFSVMAREIVRRQNTPPPRP